MANSNTIITIARSYGSGGRIIGKMLSEKLDIPYYDRNLVYLASNQSGIDLKYFTENDEDVKRRLFESIIPSENRRYVSRDDIFECQARIIRETADKGDCIIIGRCGDYVLRESRHKILKVFVWASERDCIRRIMEKFSVSESEAVKMITEINKHRFDYYRYHTGKDWRNAENYDLCINTSKYSYEQSVKAIIGYADIFRNLC